MVPRRRSPRSFVTAVVLATVAVACSRTPPEPDPASASNDSAVTTASSRAAVAVPASVAIAPRRCVTKLSEAAPKIPTAAPEGRCPADPEPNLSLSTAEVVFPEARGSGTGPGADLKVRAELAKSPHEVERGLMFRRTMADDRGMLFKLEGRSDHQFWMHNTCIPLDMMFIDDDGVIVGIVEGAEPLTDTVRSVGCPSLFVLEMNGGWSRKHGVAPGQKVALPAAIR